MIFISHNYKDKEFIGPMTETLKECYGESEIFFDSWSIKPGENIIFEMNKGLEKTKFFFFFISQDSLNSDMVQLEWTAALKERSKRDIKFIPIRCDNVDLPLLISSLNYLDLYNNGLDATLVQMKEIIEGDYKEKNYPTFNNLQAYALSINSNEVSFFIVAKRFFEPSSMFLLSTNLNEEEVNVKVMNVSMYNKNYNPESALSPDGLQLNTFKIGTQGGVKKGFKIEIRFKRVSGNLKFIDLNHIKGENKFPKIPIQLINDISEIEL